MKKKLFSALIILTALMCLLMGTVYAWISFGDTTSSMTFKILKIDSTVTLSKVNDSNFNGVPDFDADGKPSITEIGTQIAMEEESAAVDMAMNMVEILPTQIHIFHLFIENNGDVDNEIRVTFTGYNTADYLDESGNPVYDGTDFDYFKQCIKILSVRVGLVKEDGTIEYGQKHFFANAVFGEDGDNCPSNFTVISGIDIGNLLVPTKSNKVELYLKFEFETREALEEQGIVISDYQDYQGREFRLPVMSVYLEIIASEEN